MASKYAIEHIDHNMDFIAPCVEGKYDIPFIRPEPYVKCKYFPFGNKNAQYKRREHGLHFFVYDYRFSVLWTTRSKYQNMLPEFRAVLAPDFSLYYDSPIMVQMWNHYRKHLLAAWMQSIGCRVYPVIRWGDKRSWDFCFDGEPYNATVCVSSKGMLREKEEKRIFLEGYDKMLEVLAPETIMFYGSIPKECKGNIIPVDEFTRRFKELE